MLVLIIAITAILQLAIATNVSPPILYSRHGAQHGLDSLEKRADCGDGTRCLLGSCCGDGCAMNCCALDNGGLGCGIAERCQFRGNVFVGCCGNFLGGCTGEATRVTVHTPYSTVTLGAATTTTDAETEVSTTATSTSTTTTERTVTTATATATATTTTSRETGSSSRVSASSSSARTSTTTTSTTARTTTTDGLSQTSPSPSPSPSPNPNGGFSVGVEVPVLAGMVALGAVLL